MRISTRTSTRIDVTIVLAILPVVLFATRRIVNAEDHPPFAVSISTPQPKVTLHEAIPLTISVRNVSDRDIRISEVVADRQAQLDYEIVVTDPHGQPVKFRKGVMTRLGDGGVAFISLQPGEEHAQYASIGTLFDLSEPGAYKVQVKRDVPMYLGKGQVKSNILVISIVR
jgi:hypothetical protein